MTLNIRDSAQRLTRSGLTEADVVVEQFMKDTRIDAGVREKVGREIAGIQECAVVHQDQIEALEKQDVAEFMRKVDGARTISDAIQEARAAAREKRHERERLSNEALAKALISVVTEALGT